MLPMIEVKGFTHETLGNDLCRQLVNALGEILCSASQLIDPNLKPVEKWKQIQWHLHERRIDNSDEENSDEELPDVEEDVNFRSLSFGNLDLIDIGRELREMRPDANDGKVETKKRVTVIIHSIDGEQLRHMQYLLSDIASTPEVQLIASLDDTSNVIWSKEILERFCWWWLPVHTFETYDREYPLYQSKVGKRVTTFADLKQVLYTITNSMPVRGAKAFLALVELQQVALESKSGNQRIQKKEWTAKCQIDDGVLRGFVREWTSGSWLEENNAAYRILNVSSSADLSSLRDLMQQVIDEKSSKK